MNNQRITDYLNEVFMGLPLTAELIAQKEALEQTLVETMQSYMQASYPYDQALDKAIADLGDMGTIRNNYINANASTKHNDNGYMYTPAEKKEKPAKQEGWHFRLNRDGLVAMSPFIYIALGAVFGWWAWAWVIIPMSAIIFSADMLGPGKDLGPGIVAISPFIYVLLGFWFGWWAWGWLVIPVSAIVIATDK